MERADETARVFAELHDGLPRQGPARVALTARAFGLIAGRGAPRILDIGCGAGTPTMELARLAGTTVTGIDTQLPLLRELQARAALARRAVAPVCASMASLPFRPETFDILWAEGAIYSIGFERGLREWRPLLRPGGHMALHEAVWLREDPPAELRRFWGAMYPGMTDVQDCIRTIERCGYAPVAHFVVPQALWWDEYYGPLRERIRQLRPRHEGDPRALAVLEEKAREAEMYLRYGEYVGAAFFVMRRG